MKIKFSSYITILTLIITAGCCCSMRGMRAPPDATVDWFNCDPNLIDKLGTNTFFDKKYKDMRECGYDPYGGEEI